MSSACLHLFFCKQKTAYEMRISDWSSDVCSSDLLRDVSFVARCTERNHDLGPRTIPASTNGILGNQHPHPCRFFNTLRFDVGHIAITEPLRRDRKSDV